MFRSFYPLLTAKRLAILEAVVIGLVAALAAVLLKQSVNWLGAWRIQESLGLPAWALLPGMGLGGGYLAGWLIERVAPEAAGSGVPQVKAALAYIPIALNLRVAIVKLISTTLTLSSGFVLGRQGPTVQIGAALAAQLSRWVPTSPDHQRQLIAAGAAAGLAAGFDAPIAGVMFVIEELLRDLSNVTLGTAILASFTGGVISRLLGGPSIRLGINPAATQNSFSLPETPFFLLLGILVGILAALFNRSIIASLQFNRRMLPLRLPWKIGLVGLISGLVTGLLPIDFRDTTSVQIFLTADQGNWQMIAGAFIVQFILTIVACSVETPGGLFVPSLVLGAALGHLVGLVASPVSGGDPVIYALTGMGAFFGAVAKVPITAIVIVFEMTTSFKLVLPLMISSVTAYLVTEQLAPGSLYTNLLALKGIHLESDTPNDGLWARLTAAEVMQTKVEILKSQMTLDEVMQAFARSHHRGFPVLDQGRLVGIVTQTDLDKIGQRQLSGTACLHEIMTPHPITVSPYDTLTQVLYLLSRYKLSRLPVVEHRKLVGIITRSDILQVESDKLRREDDQPGPRPEPSYVVYQTRSPATGQGRLLVPISNPQTVDRLVQLAGAIARDHQFEIECLQVIPVPRHSSPAETTMNTTLSRRLLKRVDRQGQHWHIPTHTQIRLSHTIAQAVLETVKERHIDLLLMGWKGSTSTPGRIFGDTVDTAIRQAACDVVLVKFGKSSFSRWLIPIAGGPNARYAIKLLPALAALHPQAEIRLCQIFHTSDDSHSSQLLEEEAAFLRQRLPRVSIITTLVCAHSVAEAVVDMAQKTSCDVIMLGASREGLLQQAIQGNIPETIARQSDCTVILVRKAA
ncbi:chloride channel protein [Pantanalinema sp. GBBB05]|uniref:chloride channel protein n=1 Tax=Pantanalinema sp. GBBB05 TaxID=2604139 RepID=UPI001DF07AB3|nr:CBS domain-containing protein [Pantanalinema sp. GBBB05]